MALLATAFLVFWMYLGSLINFHQHHIFGRTLIPNGIISKREEDTSLSEDLPSFDLFNADACADELIVRLPGIPECDFLFSECQSCNSILNGIPVSHGLRAPPSLS
ncbi:MAG TPA: hypothetical protein PLV51_00070 [Lentimicrobium sp.]|jgi:hypothetical protein|nr:hypothetical protein [Lentimicrobium sp.]